MNLCRETKLLPAIAVIVLRVCAVVALAWRLTIWFRAKDKGPDEEKMESLDFRLARLQHLQQPWLSNGVYQSCHLTWQRDPRQDRISIMHLGTIGA